MKTTGKICLFVIALVGTALAQNRLVNEPAPAVSGPGYDLGIGYSYVSMAMPSAGRVNLNGVNASGSIALSPRWGATIDTGYSRTSDVLGTSHPGYALTTQGGPVFYPLARGNTRMFLHALAGAALIDGAVPFNQTQFYHGWLFRPAYTVGGGFEHYLSGPLGVRVSGDYLRTSFYDSVGAVQPQNNLQLTVSLLFRLAERQHRSGAQLW